MPDLDTHLIPPATVKGGGEPADLQRLVELILVNGIERIVRRARIGVMDTGERHKPVAQSNRHPGAQTPARPRFAHTGPQRQVWKPVFAEESALVLYQLVALILPATNFIRPSNRVCLQATSVTAVPKSLNPEPVGVALPN